MKKKIGIGVGIFVIILIIAGIITNYVDGGRVRTGNEPKCCVKIVSNDGNKVTYWGLGYKVVRYVGVSTDEPYENNIGVKMGSWFMKYELPKSDVIEIEYEGQTVAVTNIKDIEIIENILLNSKYDGEICNEINTHKITMNNEIYYLKESCQEIQKGNKQAKISKEDLETINNIISNEDFEILFKDRQPIDSYNKIYAILDKSETNKYNYTIYAYDGSVSIRIGGEEYSLKEALLENKITMEEIIEKANQDLKEKNITGNVYLDGGSMIYQYSNYTIIKCNTLDGNRDVYIGTKDMTINDLEI